MLNRIVTGAHFGLRDWLIQRITAVVMVLYSLIINAPNVPGGTILTFNYAFTHELSLRDKY